MSGDMRKNSGIENNHTVEEDNKNIISIEETNVNLNSVKKELNEEVNDFEETTCVKKELEDSNVFESVTVNDKLIKLENVKEEDKNFDCLHCNKCNGSYIGYCLNCSTLSHILNNIVQFTNSKSELNTIPKNILEIRDTSQGKGVFLLQTLPKDVTFGPFEGISGIKTTKSHCWKINNKKLTNLENGNWMKHILCAMNILFKNLDIYQIGGKLYYKSIREIMEGEELLIYYDDEKLQRLDNSEECYYTPQMQDKLPKIFACSLCCFGFSLEERLKEHKKKCPHAEYSSNIKDFELIECLYCKIWLEKREYQMYHLPYCEKRISRISMDDSQSVDQSEVIVQAKEDRKEEYECSQCTYKTNRKKNLQKHLNRHKKPFHCDLCTAKFAFGKNLKMHIKAKHSDDASEKDYKCPECLFQTNYKDHLQMHLNMHKGIRPYKCDMCTMEFLHKGSLKRHIKDKHEENESAKNYQCTECSFQTKYKKSLTAHLFSHSGFKPYQCHACEMKLTSKNGLNRHIKNKHSEIGTAKDYQCSECSYQTNRKRNLVMHLNVHTGIKQFGCNICTKKFTEKRRLTMHIKNKHTEDNESTKDYQCSECSFQTNYKRCLKDHMFTHTGIKPFQCDVCTMKFTKKSDLKRHTKNRHENGGAKDYLCSECAFQTNDKYSLKTHMNAHRGIKPFECNICKIKYTTKVRLNMHIENKHADSGSAKDYQCSVCSFQTNYKRSLEVHMNTHNGGKRHECDICGLKYGQKVHLKRHMKNKHSESENVKVT